MKKDFRFSKALQAEQPVHFGTELQSPMNQSSKSKFVWLLFTLVIVIVFVAVIFVLFACVTSETGASFKSPTEPANEILFRDEAFRAHSFQLFVKPHHYKGQYVADLIYEERNNFSDVQWTKDGQVIVCELQDWKKISPPAMCVAFDFSVNKIIAPQFQASDFKETEPAIKKLVIAHGGLDGHPIDYAEIKNGEKPFWTWEFPRVP
jgi:hypothetical protein